MTRFNQTLVAAIMGALAVAAFHDALARADDIKDEIDLSKEPAAAVLEVGDKAPFMGVLMTPARAARLGTKLEGCNLKLTLNEKLFDDELKIRTQALQAALDIEKQTGERERALLQKQLEAAEAREWWDHPAVLVTGGLLIGGGAVVGAVYLVAQLRPSLPR